MAQIAFGFDHDRLLQVLTNSNNFTQVVMSLCNLKRPSTGQTSMHIAAHFTNDQGKPLDDTQFEVGCPFPPGWAEEDHLGVPETGSYVVNFDELKGSPKFKISRAELLNIVNANKFENGNKRKQLLATIEATNGSEPLRTFINFLTETTEISKLTGQVTAKMAVSFAV